MMEEVPLYIFVRVPDDQNQIKDGQSRGTLTQTLSRSIGGEVGLQFIRRYPPDRYDAELRRDRLTVLRVTASTPECEEIDVGIFGRHGHSVISDIAPALVRGYITAHPEPTFDQPDRFRYPTITSTVGFVPPGLLPSAKPEFYAGSEKQQTRDAVELMLARVLDESRQTQCFAVVLMLPPSAFCEALEQFCGQPGLAKAIEANRWTTPGACSVTANSARVLHHAGMKRFEPPLVHRLNRALVDTGIATLHSLPQPTAQGRREPKLA